MNSFSIFRRQVIMKLKDLRFWQQKTQIQVTSGKLNIKLLKANILELVLLTFLLFPHVYQILQTLKQEKKL